MGLKWIEQKWEEEGNDEQEQEETILNFVLEMDEVSEGKKEIREALSRKHGSIPPLSPYSPHPDNDLQQRIFVAGFRPTRQVPGANIWDLQVTYSSEIDLPENPLNTPMKWSIDTEIEEEPSFRDFDGTPYVNTAGECIIGTNDVAKLILSGAKFISTNWPDWLLTYAGAVNSDDVQIKGKTWPAKTLKCLKIKIGEDDETKAGIDFCQLDLELAYNQKGWQFDFLNRGFYKKTPKPLDKSNTIRGNPNNKKNQKYDYQKLMVKNEHGAPEYPSEPQPLDKLGAQIQLPCDPSQLVVITFNRNARLPFSALPLK